MYIGKVLKRLRAEKGITQEELAFNSQIAERYIGYLEANKRQPSLTTIFHLSKALGMTPSEFVKEVEKDKNWD
ncbi:helix-turn-helix transcriptional regulator [Bacillus sp. DNRA2]|nr:helix-turn-helix transcriptional regulator [Bacillus sp. DNRA2]